MLNFVVGNTHAYGLATQGTFNHNTNIYFQKMYSKMLFLKDVHISLGL